MDEPLHLAMHDDAGEYMTVDLVNDHTEISIDNRGGCDYASVSLSIEQTKKLRNFLNRILNRYDLR